MEKWLSLWFWMFFKSSSRSIEYPRHSSKNYRLHCFEHIFATCFLLWGLLWRELLFRVRLKLKIGSLTSCAFRFHPRYWLHRAKETCIASTLCVSAKTDRQLRSMYHLFPTPTRHSYVCKHCFACNTPCVHVQRTLFSPTRPNPPKHPKPIAPTWRASRRTFRVEKLDTWIFGCFGVPEGPK